MYMLEASSSTVVDALTTAFSGVASDIQSSIVSILPIALGVVGTIMVIGIGMKVFQKVSGARK